MSQACVNLVAFGIILVSGCGYVHNHAGFVPIEPSLRQTQATGDIAQVVMVYNGGICTGTVVADNLVLTAAHCDRGTPFKVYHHDGPLLGETSTRFAPEKNDPDIALLQFPAGTFRLDPLKLAFEVEQNDTVEVIGFGCNDAVKQLGQAIKRRGSNHVLEIFAFITLFTPLVRDGRTIVGSDNTAGICSGDSGSPLLKNGAVVGVGTISEVRPDRIYSWFVNLNLPAARAFLGTHLSGIPQ